MDTTYTANVYVPATNAISAPNGPSVLSNPLAGMPPIALMASINGMAPLMDMATPPAWLPISVGAPPNPGFVTTIPSILPVYATPPTTADLVDSASKPCDGIDEPPRLRLKEQERFSVKREGTSPPEEDDGAPLAVWAGTTAELICTLGLRYGPPCPAALQLAGEFHRLDVYDNVCEIVHMLVAQNLHPWLGDPHYDPTELVVFPRGMDEDGGVKRLMAMLDIEEPVANKPEGRQWLAIAEKIRQRQAVHKMDFSYQMKKIVSEYVKVKSHHLREMRRNPKYHALRAFLPLRYQKLVYQPVEDKSSIATSDMGSTIGDDSISIADINCAAEPTVSRTTTTSTTTTTTTIAAATHIESSSDPTADTLTNSRMRDMGTSMDDFYDVIRDWDTASICTTASEDIVFRPGRSQF
mmetsp:Transcript_115058/g.200235  ORF Transcript_115058/g.200235 Transcript_115058/m.200235 type:complete len:410 (-) Transcript_115058:695-1924(-)